MTTYLKKPKIICLNKLNNHEKKELFKGSYYWKLLIDRAEDIQKEFACVLTALEKYKLTKPEWTYRWQIKARR